MAVTPAASSNKARLRVIPEVDFGTTPSTGTSTDLRFTGESINYNITTETSQEIRSDRQIADLVQVGAEVAGDVQFELSYGSFDVLLAAVLAGAWDTNVLKNGNAALPTFSIEKGFTDISQFLLYKGMAVSSFNLDFAIDAILTGSVGFMGQSAIRTAVTGVPAAADQTTTSVMNSASDFAVIKMGDTAQDCLVSSLSLAIDAGLRSRKALGHLGACEILPGTMGITGNIEMYFADGTQYDRYIQGTPFALEFGVEDADGNRYDFLLPKVKLTTGEVVAGGLDSDVMVSAGYQALFDPVTSSTIKVTRTPA